MVFFLILAHLLCVPYVVICRILYYMNSTTLQHLHVILLDVHAILLCSQQATPSELWQLIHNSYGEELGLTTDDEDYVAPDGGSGGSGEGGLASSASAAASTSVGAFGGRGRAGGARGVSQTFTAIDFYKGENSPVASLVATAIKGFLVDASISWSVPPHFLPPFCRAKLESKCKRKCGLKLCAAWGERLRNWRGARMRPRRGTIRLYTVHPTPTLTVP